MITSEELYSIIERDADGKQANVIRDLPFSRAELVMAAMLTGTNYQTLRPWQIEVVKQLSRAEEITAGVDAWMASPDRITSRAVLAGVLTRLGERLAGLGDGPMPAARLAVDISFFKVHQYDPDHDADRDSAEAQHDMVDLLGELLGLETELVRDQNSQYVYKLSMTEGNVDGVKAITYERRAGEAAVAAAEAAEADGELHEPVVGCCVDCDAELGITDDEDQGDAETVEHKQVAFTLHTDGTRDIECSCGTVYANIAPADLDEVLAQHFTTETVVAA
jgi:hypothetical protein